MQSSAAIRFDPQSDVPAVRQIADNLRILLVDRTLEPGTQLPSMRRLALELGVHFSTVAEAYRELASEGWLDLRHGRGATVLERSVPVLRRTAWVDEFRDRLRGLIAQTRAGGAPGADVAAELMAAAKEISR
jgi:DNA-binding transcriptional regulator YhcF (GntR family)